MFLAIYRLNDCFRESPGGNHFPRAAALSIFNEKTSKSVRNRTILSESHSRMRTWWRENQRRLCQRFSQKKHL